MELSDIDSRLFVAKIFRPFSLGEIGTTSPTGFDLRVGGRVWLDGRGWEVPELTGYSARLLREGCLRTVSIASLATSEDASDPAETVVVPADDLWSNPQWSLPG
jgi:hypothetical protein